MDNVQPYRQPLVTATGIFLGFMLNFANGWMPDAFTKHKIRDAIIAVGTLASIALLIVVLYRILKINYRQESALKFYKETLRLFIIAISIPFFTMVLILLRKLVLNFS